MALKILLKVTSSGEMERDGCYIQLQPYLPFKLTKIPVLLGIWASKEDYENSSANPTIKQLNEIKAEDNIYYLNPENAGDIYEGKNIVYKMLMWTHEAIKTKILSDNPSWKSDDIEIVDIPKI